MAVIFLITDLRRQFALSNLFILNKLDVGLLTAWLLSVLPVSNLRGSFN